MKFTHIDISGFGVWDSLELPSLSPLTVLFGANEAGKTTILECLRSVLYGFSPGRRDRYLPPLHGGQGGAQLGLQTGDHHYSISRVDDGSRLRGGVTVTASDGTTQGDSQLTELLAGVDEQTYANVFAVGLRELQELATLEDTQAAEWLYELSTGLDGVSIREVLAELRASRTRILSGDGDTSRLIELITRREAIRAEMEELAELPNRYWKLSSQLAEIDAAIGAAGNSTQSLSAEIETNKIALSVHEPWRQRDALTQRIAEYKDAANLPADSLRRLERIVAGIRKARRRRAQIRRRRHALRVECQSIAINESLWRLAPRVAALVEHEPWIITLEDQIRAAEQRVAQHEDRIAAACSKYGLPAGAVAKARIWTSHGMAAVRGPATQLRAAGKRLKAARDECRTLLKSKDARRQDVERALAGRTHGNLAQALEQQGQLVAQYRRRLQLDDRLDQLALHRQELEEKRSVLTNRQVMPLWLLSLIASIFVLGAGLVLAGLIIPLGIGITLVGGLIAVGAVGGKLWFEHATTSGLNATKRQLQMLEGQAQQAKLERGELDQQLPQGGGALASRLQAAEAELASLEDVLSIDSGRQAAETEAASAKDRLKNAAQEWTRAKQRWTQALDAMGLPSGVSPSQVKQILAQSGSLESLQGDLARARDERDRHRRELSAVTARIGQIELDAGLGGPPANEEPNLVNRLRNLRAQVGVQEELIERRSELEHRLEHLRRLWIKYGRRARELVRRRRELFASANVIDEQEFRHLASDRSVLDQLLRDRAALSGQIQSALQGRLSESDIADRMAQPLEELEKQLTALRSTQDAAAAEVKRLCERRGQIAAEQASLASDRRLAEKQLDLDALESHIAETAARWRVLAITEHLIESIKADYERNRQPEVLADASQYLLRMTEGRYRRVWTALDERALRVDDDQDRSLAIEVLSTGAREQLFLCLRLALAARYSRQGKPMPLVLDDVLVNFDRARGAAAAAVIAGFASADCQILLFTCHEHIFDLFQSMGSDVRALPASTDAARKVVEPTRVASEPLSEPPPRRREKRSKGQKPDDEPERKAAAVSVSTVQFDSAWEAAAFEEVAFPPSFLPPDSRAQAPAEAETTLPLAPAQPPKAMRRRRSDPPHRLAPAKIARRRWTAEEFEGELEDQVNAAVSAFAPSPEMPDRGESDARNSDRDRSALSNGDR